MKISTPVAVAIIGLAVLVIAGVGYYQYQQTVEPPPVADGRPFHTEEEWTVLQVAQMVADLGAFSQKHAGHLGVVSLRPATTGWGPFAKLKQSPGEPAIYEVKGDHRKQEISVSAGVWNPAIYTPWAKDVFAPADPAVPAFSSLEMAKTLLTPGFDVFFSENKRISGFLAEHPASAAGQLQAALLVGTIALNDFAGPFEDQRIPLNRMTAHLAAADALGLAPSDPGRMLAEAIRLTLCGQQAAALQKIAALGDDPALAEWGAVLRLRNTMDWRDGRAAALQGSLALKHEYFRALARANDPMAGLDFLQEAKAEPDAAYWRIADEADLSVQTGHVFAKNILSVEFKEIAEAAQKFGLPVSKENQDWLKEYLDTPEGSPVTEDGKGIQVAGRNLFGGYHQRHLMQGGQRLFAFLNDQWGVRDKAKSTAEFLTEKLPDLRYKPFMVRMIARDQASRAEANKPCEVITRDHPEMVTACMWANLRLNEDGKQVISAPSAGAWFLPVEPRGTAFEVDSRLYDLDTPRDDAAWLKDLHETAPYAFGIAMRNAFVENHRSWEPMDGDMLARWFGPLADYNVDAIKRVARSYGEKQPDKFEAGMEKAAAFDPDTYLTMGRFFEEHGPEEKAAKYYLLAFEKANNRVWMANRAGWLVKYLYRKNDLPMATKVAEDAADVYSAGGLEAYGWLMEAQGKWPEALETARKIDERYNDGRPTSEIGCLMRYKAAEPEAADSAGFQEKLGEVFPNALKKAALGDFSAPPDKGVLFNALNRETMTPFGLAQGMVVVALNGYRTETLSQYLAIRSLSDDPKMSLVVWDGKAYRVSEVQLPERRFSVDMVDYVAK